MKTITIALMLLAAINAGAQTDSTAGVLKNEIAVEFDPAPFILGGYSVSVKYSPARWNHISMMGSVYSSHFPDRMMSKPNFNAGFRDLRIETSFAFFADYFLRDDRNGFHFGPSVFVYSKSVGHELTSERTAFRSIYPNVRAGYVYTPFKKLGFYINPWINAGREMKITGSDILEGHTFAAPKCSYIMAVHVGYRHRF